MKARKSYSSRRFHHQSIASVMHIALKLFIILFHANQPISASILVNTHLQTTNISTSQVSLLDLFTTPKPTTTTTFKKNDTIPICCSLLLPNENYYEHSEEAIIDFDPDVASINIPKGCRPCKEKREKKRHSTHWIIISVLLFIIFPLVLFISIICCVYGKFERCNGEREDLSQHLSTCENQL